MILLALGVLIFSVLHLVPALPAVKAEVVERVGQRGYGPLFGSVSVLALVLIVLGWRMSAFVPVYEPPEWGRYANFVFMLAAFICLGIFLFRGGLRQRLRFPMGIAVLFWGTGHLLANGDLRSLILFGGFLTYAIIHIAISIINDVGPSPEVRSGHDAVSILAGIALYGAMTQLHPVLIGVPILNLQH
jgi:uncharacterized membrane protein